MDKKNILLLGGDGYIGSVFSNSRTDITTIDIGWFSDKHTSIDYNDLTKDYISNFSDIVLLAGHSSVLMCKNSFDSVYKNNIRNFGNLLTKIDDQKIIYASSSSIYNGCSNIADETFINFIGTNEYDISKYTIDLLASMSGKRFYGLRFGTVNGKSENMRWDLMMNKMVFDAIIFGNINVYNENVRRPVLFIDTLSKCVNTIIEGNGSPGFYNLCNTNSTIDDYAKIVKDVVESKLKTTVDINYKGKSDTYDFEMSNDKFSKEYEYHFDTDVRSLIYGILETSFKNGKTRNDKRIY